MPNYTTTFDDLLALLKRMPQRAVVALQLRKWFGYEVIGPENDPEIRSACGDPVSLEHLLHRLETDPPGLLDSFHQRKMSCRHWDDFAERDYRQYLAGHRPDDGRSP